MELEIPKSEIINNIFKDKTTDRKNLITTNPKNKINIENKKNENIQNNEIDLSQKNLNNKELYKKRRQGLWLNNINLFQKEEEKVETPIPIIQEEVKEEKIKRKRDNIIKAYNVLSEFIYSQIGCFIMLFIVFFILCYYDLKMIFFSNKYKYFYNGCYIIFNTYSAVDFVIRTIIIENLIKSLYFWIDLLSLVIIIFDFDSISYPLLNKILNHHSKTKYISYQDQGRIEILLNVFQIVKLFRVVKFYKLFVDLIKEKEKKNNIMKILGKINEKKNRTNKNKLIKHIRATYIQMREFNNTTTMPLATTPMNHWLDPSFKPSNLKKINDRSSIFTSNISQENRKWEEDAIKYLEEHIYKKNKISQKITEGISRLMIVIVLLVFIVSIFTDEDSYNLDYFSYKIVCKVINKFVENKKINNVNDVSIFVNNYLLTNILNLYPIIQVEWKDNIVYQNKSMNLNLKEYMRRDICYIFDLKDPSTIIIISRKYMSKMSSLIYLCRLFYIVICISCLCYLINIDVYQLIFHPLEKIGKVIDVVSKDPVGSKTIVELKNNMENKETNKKEDKNSVSHEIKIIQSAIIRISALMAIGFGEAGGEILKENISSSEGINPMLPGKKISAIFGFCFIHNFSEINEAFQERTMIFVNQISDIVHSCVDKFNGITNKNLGDCYLLAWKFKEKTDKKVNEEINNFNTNEIKISGVNDSNISNKKEEMADCALLGFLNIIKKINKNRNILAYRKDSDLIKKFGPKYSVQMGFGLHTGWGIEGAIGSYYKIDCSYLSPNVNIAARLETATNIYGVDILFSGEFYDLLSDFMKRLCRKIDIVTLKGSEKPVRLYTVDINKNIHPGKLMSKKDRMTLRERRSYYASKKKKLWHKFQRLKSNSSIGEIYLKQSKGLSKLLKKTKSDIFYQYFEDGFGDYIDGEWKDAAQNLEKARYLDKSDGPTKTILDYIKKLHYKAPTNWDGYRVLTSKT